MERCGVGCGVSVGGQFERRAWKETDKKLRVKELREMPRTLLGQNFNFRTFLMRARIQF